MFFKNLIGRLASRDVRLKTNEFLPIEFFEIDAFLFCKWMLRADYQNEGVIVKRMDFQLLMFFRVGD